MSEPIQLDGQFDEPAWRVAAPIGPLRQREPVEAADASEATEVRIVYDADALYIAVVCHDRASHAIVATQLTRDAELDVDDHVTITSRRPAGSKDSTESARGSASTSDRESVKLQYTFRL